MAWYNATSGGSGGAAIDYVEIEITSLTNGTIDTSRGGCWYAKYGNVIHLHLAVSGLTPETTTNVFTMPEAFRPPHVTCMGIGIGADRLTKSSVSVGAQSGVCNLWSESTTAVIDVEWLIDADASSSAVETDVTSLITKNSQYTFSNLKYEAKRVGNTIFMVAESNVDNAPSVGTGFKAFDIDASIRPSTAHANWCWGASSSNAVVSVSATGAITVTGGAWFRFEVFWFI